MRNRTFRNPHPPFKSGLHTMAFVEECAIGTYVAIPMRITDVQPKWTSTENEPYLQLMGVDTEGGVVGPLRLWQREEGDVKLGGAYVVRGLRVVNDRAWDPSKCILAMGEEYFLILDRYFHIFLFIDGIKFIHCF